MAKQILCGSALLMVLAVLAGPARAEEKAVAQTVTMGELNQLIGGPTLVTLHFQNAAPKTIFAELARQAKVTIDTSPLDFQPEKPLAPISVDVVRQPFWPVIRSLCTRLHVAIYADASGGLFVQRDTPNSLTRGPVCSLGPVLLVADSGDRSVKREYSSSGDRTQDRGMSLLIIVDPKLRLLGDLPKLQLNAAIDEKGRKLFKAGSTPSSGQGNPFELSTRIDYHTTGGPSDSRRLADLKGTGKLFVGFNVQRWEVPDVLQAKNVVRTIKRGTGTSRYVFSGLEVTDNNYIVHLTISKREFDLQDQFALEADFDLRVHLYDAQGHEFGRVQFGAKVGDDTDPVSLTVPFERPDDHSSKPAKLVVEIPDVRAVEVPFEFKDLPLP